MNESTAESSTEVSVGLTEKRPIRILHVDDDPGFLRVAKECLKMQGEFQVETAMCVEEAKDKLGREKYDVIVSDYQLPGKDGLEFLKELRKEGNDIPFIIFTGKGREEIAIKALNLGADGYFNKAGQLETVYGELAHGIRQTVERRMVEEALRTSHAEYRYLTQNIPGMTYRGKSPDWSVGIISRSEEVCGYSSEDFVSGKVNWLDLIYPEDKKRVMEEASKTSRKPLSIVQVYRIIHRDGGIRWVEDHKTSIFSTNGDFEGTDGVVFDVTERKKAEEALKESEEKYRKLLQDSGRGVGFYDLQGNVLLMNVKALGQLNRPEKEIVGKPVSEVFGKNVGDMIVKRIEEIAKSGKPESYEDCVELPSGKKWFLSTFSAIRNDKGKISGVQVISFDISEKKKTTEALKESLEKLRVLSGKLVVVGKLTRHDVRNKLSAVVGNTFLAKEALPNDHKALAYLEGIESASWQITKILDFAAAYESIGAEELTSIDVGKTVEEAASLFSGLQGVKIANECHGLTVMADSLMGQLFYNLIDNSLKHGKKVSRINVHYEKTKDGVKLFYEDDGVGIPKASKAKIFDLGFTTGNGSGYGLPLIKKMMEIYGWTIQETGTPSKGAKFVITILKTNLNAKENSLAH